MTVYIISVVGAVVAMSLMVAWCIAVTIHDIKKTEKKWREKLSEQSIKIINKHLDPEVLTFYNYSLIT